MLKEIRTLPDKILNNIELYNRVKKDYMQLKYLAQVTKISKKKAEFWIEFLEKQKLLEIIYPLNIFADPRIKMTLLGLYLGSDMEKERTLKSNQTKLDEYSLKADKLQALIRIWKIPSEDVSFYELITPKISYGTQALLDGLLDELTKKVPLSSEEINDPKKRIELIKQYLNNLIQKVKEKVPEEPEEVIESIASILLHRMYGLDKLDVFLADDLLEEIAINGAEQPISVYHKRYGWLKTLEYLGSENEIFNIAAQIGRKSGQQINSLNPIMDAHLFSGDRVASTIHPISTNGNTITIRRFSRNPWTVTQFVNPKRNLFSKEVAALIWMAMQFELNIIIAGGTASGKTSALNVLCSFIQPTNRVLSIEDTREIALPASLYWNWVPLASREANPEGQGKISMLDLIVASLRMRPDRIIVGEIRRKEQAQALFEAMHTGHSVYATMHADTAAQVKRRLLEPPIEVPKTELGSLHLIVIQFRDRKTGKRRTLEVVEVLDNKDDIELNYLYRWHPRTDTFERVNQSRRIYEDLSLHTGLTPKEIDHDIKQKGEVLQWMEDNKLEDVNQVGQVMRVYYKDKDFLIKAIKDKTNFADMLAKFEHDVPKEHPAIQESFPLVSEEEFLKIARESPELSKKLSREKGIKAKVS